MTKRQADLARETYVEIKQFMRYHEFFTWTKSMEELWLFSKGVIDITGPEGMEILDQAGYEHYRKLLKLVKLWVYGE